MKIKNILAFLSSLLLVIVCNPLLRAQSCPENVLYFNLQSQIDQFPSLYPDCTSCENSIYIDNGFGGDITNLDSLMQITAIGGDLHLFYLQNLSSLRGLDQLETVGGSLNIQLIDKLTNFSHLEQLKNVSHLGISENNNLVNLDGLQGLKKISGTLNIHRNDQLNSFIGLNNLEEIGGKFTVSQNDLLKDFNGLNSLHTIKDLSITKNPQLHKLSGLNALQNVISDFEILDNNRLESLIGLESLMFIGGIFSITENRNMRKLDGINPVSFTGLEELSISYNPSLESLDGLSDLGLGNIQTVRITFNPELDICAVNSICDYLSLCKNIIIYGNARECDDVDLLEWQCNYLADYDFQWNCRIKIQPNPSNDYLNINIYSQHEVGFIEYKIMDMRGRLIMEGQQSDKRLDVSALAAGAYFLTIQTDLQTAVQRFVKN